MKKEEARQAAVNSITPRRNSRRGEKPTGDSHAPNPSAAVTSGGHYVSAGDLLSVRLYQFFGALSVLCVVCTWAVYLP